MTIDQIQSFEDAYTLLRATRYRVKYEGGRFVLEGADPYVDKEDLQQILDHYQNEMRDMLLNPELMQLFAMMKSLFGTTFECFVKVT